MVCVVILEIFMDGDTKATYIYLSKFLFSPRSPSAPASAVWSHWSHDTQQSPAGRRHGHISAAHRALAETGQR